MKTQTALIDALRAAFPNESDAAIARRAKLSQQRFSNYAQAARTMDDDAVIGCAALVGWDPKKTLAQHHAETAKTDRERAFWRQLAAAAGVSAVALLALGVIDLNAHEGIQHAAILNAVANMHYAKLRMWLIRAARTLRTGLGNAVTFSPLLNQVTALAAHRASHSFTRNELRCAAPA